jgi:hypothetical protein
MHNGVLKLAISGLAMKVATQESHPSEGTGTSRQTTAVLNISFFLDRESEAKCDAGKSGAPGLRRHAVGGLPRS